MDPRRRVPSVDLVAERLDGLPRPMLVEVARCSVVEARRQADEGKIVDVETVIAAARSRVDGVRASRLRRVVNATGVLLHTNLGRAPVSLEALEAAADVGAGYANLEYRLDTGHRGSRHENAGRFVASACGAESGMVVNNNAGAVLLVLAALARGRGVVVSRGELIEIGGEFRMPDIIQESGARLIACGTTNRTRRADYSAAINAETAVLLKVHTSNYEIVGFAESAPVAELANLGPTLVVDAGSGLIDRSVPWLDERPTWLDDEPGVRQCLESGADIVTFSGDKLFGGPQAGIIVGRSDLLEQVQRHPLARALRCDKLTLAGLQQVATSYLEGTAHTLPFWEMADRTRAELRQRAEAIVREVQGVGGTGTGDEGLVDAGRTLEIVGTEAVAGGGTTPGRTIDSVGIAVPSERPEATLSQLREYGVVARTVDERVVCDLRTVGVAEDLQLRDALSWVLDPGSPGPPQH